MVKIPKDKSYREWLAERMAETDTAESKKRADETDEPVGESLPTDVTPANLPPEPADGIITLSGDDNNMKERGASGLRRSPFITLTDEDIIKLKEDIKAIEADESV